MPFIGLDWRSPGEHWIKTPAGSWERLKILENSPPRPSVLREENGFSSLNGSSELCSCGFVKVRSVSESSDAEIRQENENPQDGTQGTPFPVGILPVEPVCQDETADGLAGDVSQIGCGTSSLTSSPPQHLCAHGSLEYTALQGRLSSMDKVNDSLPGRANNVYQPHCHISNKSTREVGFRFRDWSVRVVHSNIL